MSSLKKKDARLQVCECLICEMPKISDLKTNTTAAANKGENTIPKNHFYT